MLEKQDWIQKKIEFKDYVKIFSPSEWKAIEESGFKKYCESKEYSIEIGAAYLMSMSMIKFQYSQQIKSPGNHIFFAQCAKSTFDMILKSINQQMTSNMSAVINWLGDRLCQKIERESNLVGTQVMDLLSIESIRIALECPDSKYCANKTFSNKDVRNLIANNQMTFTQMLAIGQAIQKDLANRTMPTWTTHDPELFNMALKCNDLQLNALSEFKFDLLPQKDSLVIVTILRAIILRMEGNVDYNTDMILFKNLAIDVVKKQINLISPPEFIANLNNLLSIPIPDANTNNSKIIEEFVQVYKEPIIEQMVSSNQKDSPLNKQSLFKPSEGECKEEFNEEDTCRIS